MLKNKIRGLISLGLLLFWALSAFSGFILYLAPDGPRSGRMLLFLSLTKHEWSDIHTLFSFIALGVTILHIIVDWHILVAVIKLLLKGDSK